MSLEKDLQQEQVSHLDLNAFTAVKAGTTVATTVELMRVEKQHCAIITDQGALVGIFTDRDILTKVADSPDSWQQPIESVMTPTPITIEKSEPADTALRLMDARHFRNVPVVDQHGHVVGNLTHYAVIKYLADHFPESVYNLPPNPDHLSSSSRDGA